MDYVEKVAKFLHVNKSGFTALLVGSILAIMIGSVLLIISYVVINAIIGSTGTISNAALNTSLYANITNITAALNIAGIALIVVGISGIKFRKFISDKFENVQSICSSVLVASAEAGSNT